MTGENVADAACDLGGTDESGERHRHGRAVTQGLEERHDMRRYR